MKKSLLLTAMMAYALSAPCIAASGPPPQQKSCIITCYEKTPSCYVTQTGKDCLEITYAKPKNKKKGSYSCKLKGCDISTTYGDTGTEVTKKEND